jgi:hypothetical protein
MAADMPPGERALAAHRQNLNEAAFAAARGPLQLPALETDYLRQLGAEHALARLKQENSLLDELQATRSALDFRVIKAEERRSDRQLDLHRVIQTRSHNRRQADQDAERIEVELRDMAEQIAQLRSRRNDVASREAPLAKRIDRCVARVGRAMHGGGQLRFIAPPSIDKKLTLAKARDVIAQLDADAREIAAAPRSCAEVKAEIAAWAEREAREPQVRRMFDPNPEADSGVYLPSSHFGGASLPNALGIILWVSKDEIVRRLHAQADRLADDARALDSATRAEKLAKNREQKLHAERVEEALAWQLLQAGEQLVLRADSDVRAILSCQ